MHRATNRSDDLLVAASKHAGLRDARGVLWMVGDLVHPPASSFRVSAALAADLARRPPRIGFGLSFVGAANDLHADHPRQPETNLRAGVLAGLPTDTRHVELCAEVSRSRAAALQSFATQLLNLRADVLSLVRDELFLVHLERGDVLKRHLDEPVDRAYLARLRPLPRLPGVSGEVVLTAAAVVSSCALLLAVSELCPRRRSHLQAWDRWPQAQRVIACASSLGRLVVGAEARPPHWVMVV